MKSIKLYSENDLFIRISRISIFFTLISMLSGCCCLWYVDVDEPEIYNKQENKVKTNKIINSADEERAKKTK